MLTVLKIHYKKQKPLVVTCRGYKNFSNESFQAEVLFLYLFIFISLADFHSEFLYLFRKHARVKKRYENWANQKNVTDKELNQAIMFRSKLCNKFLKLKKWQYLENLNLSSITDIKLFWKTVSPLFTEKIGLRTK